LHDKKSHKSQISINRPSCTCTQKRHDGMNEMQESVFSRHLSPRLPHNVQWE
jgi:hypothetical protein